EFAHVRLYGGVRSGGACARSDRNRRSRVVSRRLAAVHPWPDQHRRPPDQGVSGKVPSLSMTHRTDRESLFLSLILRDFLIPHRAANDFEFEEPAFEGAVEEGRATAGCQTDQLGQTQIRREEVRTPACEVPFEAVTEPRVER